MNNKATRAIKSEKGVALMIVLIIATITLAVTTTMLYLLTQSTKYSGLSKRFATAREAGLASTEVVTDYISYKGDIGLLQVLTTDLGFANMLTAECGTAKLNSDTSQWPAGCNKDAYIDYTDNTSYDNYFDLGDFRIFTKIIFTIEGNTGSGEANELENACVVHCDDTGGLGGAKIPGTYIVEVDTRNMKNPAESAKMSLLFQY